MGNFHLNRAVAALNKGGLIAYPTEAVFGLGCYPEDVNAIAKLLSIKNRSADKGLILISANIEQLESYIDYPDDKIRQKVNATWPGPVTWLLPAKANVPPWVTGYRDTVAVRVCAHPIVQGLCNKTGVIVSTSANPAKKAPARNIIKVRSYFGNNIDYILPGKTGGRNQPTEIRNAVSGAILRTSN